MKGGRRRTLLGWFVAAVVASAAGIAGYTIGVVRAPEQLATPTPPSQFPVTVEPFADSRRVRVQLTRGAPATLVVTASGRLTRSGCVPGTPIGSGTATWSVDGEPVISLYTAEPMHRDLAAGSRGSDVKAVQAELGRLGYSLDQDGVFGPATQRAVDALRAKLGLSAASGLTMRQVVWLPGAEIAPTTCAPLGTLLQAGSGLAMTATPLIGARVQPMPDALTSGERTLVVGAAKVGVTAAGDVRGDGLTALASEPVVNVALTSPGDSALLVDGRLELTKPVGGASVPASAVLTNQGTCVVGANRVYRVVVVSSGVGQSVVSFVDGQAPQSVEVNPDRARSCG